jgi:hypothetical protein
LKITNETERIKIKADERRQNMLSSEIEEI